MTRPRPKRDRKPERGPPPRSLEPERDPPPRSLEPERDPPPRSLEPERDRPPRSLEPERGPPPRSLEPERDPPPRSLEPKRDPPPRSLEPKRDPPPRSLEPKRDPPPRSLERLAEKYRTLGELRRARARGEPLPPRAVFKAIADEFPGALSELDLLPLDEIDRRERALADAAVGGPVEAWMRWLAGYHALMRAALHIKLRLRGARDVGGDLARSLAADASAIAGDEVDEELVRAVAAPPGGRIHRAVLARLAREASEDPEAIADALFPRRRAIRGRSRDG